MFGTRFNVKLFSHVCLLFNKKVECSREILISQIVTVQELGKFSHTLGLVSCILVYWAWLKKSAIIPLEGMEHCAEEERSCICGNRGCVHLHCHCSVTLCKGLVLVPVSQE